MGQLLPRRARYLALLAVALISLFGQRAAIALADPVIAAAGDIACDPTDPNFNGLAGTATACRMKYTSDLLVAGAYAAVLPLGDLQYNSGTLSNFQQSYDPTWGRVKATTHPAIGNHEGTTSTGGAGYCAYWGAAAHCNASARQGNAAFYSYDIGTWHIIALNSNCTAAGGCDVGSPQYTFLQNDLASHPATCTLAYWHHGRFSSGHDGSNTFMQPFWKLLYDRGAEIVLSGHSHDYERFAPMDGNGVLNPSDGMRQFIVGTGGAFFTGFLATIAPNSQVRNNKTFGVLELTLHPSSYDWRFVPEAGKTFTDSGTQPCRGVPATPDTEAPTAPTGLTATAVSSSQVNLSWNASSDNVGVNGYEVRRAPAGGTPVAVATTTGTATTFSDTTVVAGQSYDYQVVAKDAAGNTSAPSNTASVTVLAAPPGGATLTFSAIADSSVKQASPTSNFGSSVNLHSDSGTGVAMESYLRFAVSGVGTAAVQRAKLRLFVPSDPTPNGPGIYACIDPACASWTETGINWNNRPPRVTTATSNAPAIPAGSFVEYDVTPLVSGDGSVTFVIGQTPTTDGTAFSSDEATTNRPVLTVATGGTAAAAARSTRSTVARVWRASGRSQRVQRTGRRTSKRTATSKRKATSHRKGNRFSSTG